MQTVDSSAAAQIDPSSTVAQIVDFSAVVKIVSSCAETPIDNISVGAQIDGSPAVEGICRDHVDLRLN